MRRDERPAHPTDATLNDPAPDSQPSRGLVGRLARSRAALATAAGVAVLAVAGTTLGYSSMSSTVTLSVDGERTDVTTMGDTVADVLEDQGIEVSERDLVAPDLDEQVEEGTQISVRYARQLELTVDGKTSTHWVTSDSVSSALGELGRTFEESRLSTSRGGDVPRGGLELEVVTPKRITVALAGRKPVTRSLPVLTVGDALTELGVDLDKRDRVSPTRATQLSDGDRVVFTDVRWATKRVKAEAVGHGTVEQEDDSMPEGETEVVTAGRDGARDATYRLIFRNGELHKRVLLRAKVLRAPVDQVVKVGTQEAPAPSNYAGGNTVWDQLAQCESGGNWSINTGNGYYGGLQFNLGTWQAYGGTGLPSENSREAQIAVAERLRAATGGYGSWPHCSAQLGLPR